MMRGAGQWMNDFRWAMNAMTARRVRRALLFSQRQTFDSAIRPKTSCGSTVAYPDAIYHITADDVIRAMNAAKT